MTVKLESKFPLKRIKLNNLKASAGGVLFDGTIGQAILGNCAEGVVIRSGKFEKGDEIRTSSIVDAGIALGIGYYIETESRHRYLIVSVLKIASLSVSTASVPAAINSLNWSVNNINKAYYEQLQWSS